jgi:hypothetical protein
MDSLENEANNSSIVAFIRCRGNVFTEPLPSNGRADEHRYPGKVGYQQMKYWGRCFLFGPIRSYIKRRTRGHMAIPIPCGGGVEYLHRDPASRRRRRKGKSRIWDSKIWPTVLRDSDPKMNAMARASRNCKRQTRPLVREGAPNQETRNCQTIIKIWS